jgi:pantoate--beta-alanine ligase
MNIVRSVQEVYSALGTKKNIGFVPTMGALHEGHLSLVARSKKDCDFTVVSIFLNPTQFDNPNDLNKYPSDIEGDLKSLKAAGVDLVWTPQFEELYPDKFCYKVTEVENSRDLCGASRPGHFDGVLSVVMKLLNIVSPQKAFFGEKDFQQLELVKGMVNAFFMKVEIVPCPTVRESSGLAMSSRNKRLTPEQKAIAPQFFKILNESDSAENAISDLISNGFEVDYVKDKSGRRYGAVKLGEVRLIDNVAI